MPVQPRKKSEILDEMSERLLRNPRGVPSSEAAEVTHFFPDAAWNKMVGLVRARIGCD
jgi:hypothetical protein